MRRVIEALNNNNGKLVMVLALNVIVSTYERYFDGFKDLLLPLYSCLLVFLDHYREEVQQSYQYTLRDSSFLGLLERQKCGREVIDVAASRLISNDTRDLLEMDDAKLFIQISRRISGMVVD
jgi:hypothetical protein